MISELDKQDLNKALEKALKLVEATVAWAEARKFTNEPEYLDWEDRINKLSVKDHNISFAQYLD